MRLIGWYGLIHLHISFINNRGVRGGTRYGSALFLPIHRTHCDPPLLGMFVPHLAVLRAFPRVGLECAIPRWDYKSYDRRNRGVFSQAASGAR